MSEEDFDEPERNERAWRIVLALMVIGGGVFWIVALAAAVTWLAGRVG